MWTHLFVVVFIYMENEFKLNVNNLDLFRLVDFNLFNNKKPFQPNHSISHPFL